MAKIDPIFAFIWASLFAIGLGWWFRPVSLPSGQIENQIRGFGPQLTSALAQKSAFSKTADGFQPKPESPAAPVGLKPQEAQAWTAFAQMHADDAALVPTFPVHYSEGAQVRGAGMTVSLRPLGSHAATARIENGKLVYHNAYQSTDSLNVVSDGRSEEFLLLRDAQAPRRFEYDISAASGVKNISVSDNAVHFTNEQGQQMQIEAPWLVESGPSVAAVYDRRPRALDNRGDGHRPPLQAKGSSQRVHWELSYPNGPDKPRLALVVADAARLRFPVVIDPTWVVTNSGLVTARYFHTATLLNNGLVLIAGGQGNSGALKTAELFNPATGTWAATGTLTAARYNHTATLLQNGEVLVAGGYNGSSYLKSAELYSPGTGSWTSTGTLNTARELHTATLLTGGNVLVAGGLTTGGTALSSAELYSPSTGSWTATTNNLAYARFLHTATLLQNGNVLVAGGTNNSGTYYNTAEVYSGGSWTTTGTLTAARGLHTATCLPTGRVLVTGGTNGSTYLASAELYTPGSTPANGTWTSTGTLSTARQSHTATLLPNGVVQVQGGYNGSYLSSVEFYNSAIGVWTSTSTITLNTARVDHTATLLPNGEVLIAGGANPSAVASSELYDPASGTWAATGSLTSARYFHTSTLLPNGQVLVAGGEDSNYNPLTVAEIFNPTTGSWTVTGSLTTARSDHTATLLPNGQVLVAGGAGNSGALAAAELYNPATGSWTATGSLTTARDSHTATLLPNGQVLVAGGPIDSNPGSTASCELYNPATGSWTATGSLTIPLELQTATLLPNGQVLVAGGDYGGASSSAELFNPGLGYYSATQPQLNAVSSANSTSALALSGSNFTGDSEGSGGTTSTSASNIPVVQLQFLGNEQVINVPLDPSHGFTSSAFTSLNVTGGVPGYALLTMFVNGTPGTSQIVSYSLVPQTIANFPSSQTFSQGAAPYTYPSQTSDGMTITYTVQSGPATISGDTLTFTGSGTVVVVATAAGNGTYAPFYATDTITVTPTPTDTPTMPEWGVALLTLLLLLAAGAALPRSRTPSGNAPVGSTLSLSRIATDHT